MAETCLSYPSALSHLPSGRPGSAACRAALSRTFFGNRRQASAPSVHPWYRRGWPVVLVHSRRCPAHYPFGGVHPRSRRLRPLRRHASARPGRCVDFERFPDRRLVGFSWTASSLWSHFLIRLRRRWNSGRSPASGDSHPWIAHERLPTFGTSRPRAVARSIWCSCSTRRISRISSAMAYSLSASHCRTRSR
jgi:hypothetical protein